MIEGMTNFMSKDSSGYYLKMEHDMANFMPKDSFRYCPEDDAEYG
jgi:hypothetical protein